MVGNSNLKTSYWTIQLVWFPPVEYFSFRYLFFT